MHSSLYVPKRADLLALILCGVLLASGCTSSRTSTAIHTPLTAEEVQLLEEGMERYDKGDLAGAREIYEQLLEAKPGNTEVLYELSMTYCQAQEYDTCLRLAREGARAESPQRFLFYHMQGISLDMMGKPREAAAALQTGIRDNNGYHALHYSLGIVQMKLNQFGAAEAAFEGALRVNPAHASSHMLLAHLRADQGRRLPALLGYSTFLLYEPGSPRSLDVITRLRALLTPEEATETADGKTRMNLNINLFAGPDDPLNTAEVALGVSLATRSLPEQQHLPEIEHIASQYRLVLEVLQNIEVEGATGYVGEVYLPFFVELSEAGHGDALPYVLLQNSGLPSVQDWLATHSDEIEQLNQWLTTHLPGFSGR